MTRRQINTALLSAASVAASGVATASEPKIIQLPPARNDRGEALDGGAETAALDT
jgi:hypothetical protein